MATPRMAISMRSRVPIDSYSWARRSFKTRSLVLDPGTVDVQATNGAIYKPRVARGIVLAENATVQRDIKKIMAYSTISQLGLMVMAVGAGSAVSGMFHLSTHAYFKSLLFLTAGAFIHHFHTTILFQ